MRKLLLSLGIVGLILGGSAMGAINTIESSTMWFGGLMEDNQTVGDVTVYTGIIAMRDEAAEGVGDKIGGFDVYGREGATAWFGDDPGDGPVWTSETITNHDAWPTWNPDTPDWYQYSLKLYVEDDQYKWDLRNHPGATADLPWYETSPDGWPKPAKGVPMSGYIDNIVYDSNTGYLSGIAHETEVGAYISGTGTPEIPGGAANHGGGAGAWDMDWSWGSEAVPLAGGGDFYLDIHSPGEAHQVWLTPVPEPASIIIWSLIGGLSWLGLGVWRRRRGSGPEGRAPWPEENRIAIRGIIDRGFAKR